MKRTITPGTARSTTVTLLLALALSACSSGSGDDNGGGNDGGGNNNGLGSVLGGASDTDDTTGGAATNPFGVTDDGSRPTEPVDDSGSTGGDTVPDFSGGSSSFGQDPDPDPDAGASPTDGPVLGRLQNRFVSGDEFDLWVCSAPQVTDLAAVGYLFIENNGLIVLAPVEGDTQAAEFTVREDTPGMITNIYTDIGATETMSGFGFTGPDAFSATSDLVGNIDCERFYFDESGDPDGGASVSAQIENGIDGAGDLSDVWICQGPQTSSDAVGYVFIDGSGLFVVLNQGQDPLGFAFNYTESGASSLSLSYQDGARETLSNIAFTSGDRFDATSSLNGPLSCERFTL